MTHCDYKLYKFLSHNKDMKPRSSWGTHDVIRERDGSHICCSTDIGFQECIYRSVGLGSCYCAGMIRRAEITDILI